MTDNWTQVGATLKRMLERMSLNRTMDGWRAVSLWDQIVNDEVAKHCRPVRYAGGRLFVQVDSPAWNYELSFSKEDLRQKLNEQLGAETVKEIVVSLAREGRR